MTSKNADGIRGGSWKERGFGEQKDLCGILNYKLSEAVLLDHSCELSLVGDSRCKSHLKSHSEIFLGVESKDPERCGNFFFFGSLFIYFERERRERILSLM